MTISRIALATTVALSLGGCTGPLQGPADWFGGSAQTRAAEPGQVYYSATPNLAVHAGSTGDSAIVGRLALHEKVSRTRLEHGYAYVTAPQSGIEGWVDNAKLIWRLPPQRTDAVQDAQPPAQATPTDPPKPANTPAPAQPAAELADAPPEPEPPASPLPQPAAPADSASKPADTPQKKIPKAFDPF